MIPQHGAGFWRVNQAHWPVNIGYVPANVGPVTGQKTGQRRHYFLPRPLANPHTSAPWAVPAKIRVAQINSRK
jgi:hypothetical protein